MNTKKVAVIVGSLRKESFNRKVAKEMIRLAPEGLELQIVEIKDLTFFTEDIENSPPQTWTDYKNQIQNSDAVLFVSPEYNRTIPGALKNAIDVGSRPPGKSIWNGLPGAVATASAGSLGGFGANHNIRQAVSTINVPVMLKPELFISKAGEIFKEDDTDFLSSCPP